MSDTQAELREQTRRSVARLISIQRGDDTWNDEDYTTAGNILFVCNRLIKTDANKQIEAVLDRLENNLVQNIRDEPAYKVERKRLNERK